MPTPRYSGLFDLFSKLRITCFFVRTNAALRSSTNVLITEKMGASFYSGKQRCTSLPSGYGYCCCSSVSTLAGFPQSDWSGVWALIYLFCPIVREPKLTPLPAWLLFPPLYFIALCFLLILARQRKQWPTWSLNCPSKVSTVNCGSASEHTLVLVNYSCRWNRLWNVILSVVTNCTFSLQSAGKHAVVPYAAHFPIKNSWRTMHSFKSHTVWRH